MRREKEGKGRLRARIADPEKRVGQDQERGRNRGIVPDLEVRKEGGINLGTSMHHLQGGESRATSPNRDHLIGEKPLDPLKEERGSEKEIGRRKG